MNTQLKPTLGTLHLWGIAVGLVISGEYFGWSYGWGVAGTLGFLVGGFVYFQLTAQDRADAPADAMLTGL